MAYAYGLTSAKLGTKGANDIMGTVLAALGKTAEGTANFMIPEKTETEFRSEEDEAPVLVISDTDKPAEFEFEVMDPDTATFQTLFGGTVTGTSPKIWEPALNSPTIELSAEFTLKTGVIIKFPRGKVSATVDSPISRKSLVGVKVKVIALKPASALLAPYSITYP